MSPKSKEEQKPKFNLDQASRKLVIMAQKMDWIAFEQALKYVMTYLCCSPFFS